MSIMKLVRTALDAAVEGGYSEELRDASNESIADDLIEKDANIAAWLEELPAEAQDQMGPAVIAAAVGEIRAEILGMPISESDPEEEDEESIEDDLAEDEDNRSS
jgi:hypothetical protein